MTTIKHFMDLGFTIQMEQISNRAEFKIFQISHTDHYDGDDDDDNEIEYFYEKKNTNCEYTTSLNDAVVFMAGAVKWDGCSNWQFDNDGVQIHGCNRQHLLNVGEIMTTAWDMANETGMIS